MPDLDRLVDTLRSWQRPGGPVQLHPGDVGWFRRFGPEATADALRVRRRDRSPVAIGLLDGSVLRLANRPDADRDLSDRIVYDLSDEAAVDTVEARALPSLDDALAAAGWQRGDTWAPLVRDLAAAMPATDVRIETVDRQRAPERTAVHRAAFGSESFTVDRWSAMASSATYREARCLLARDAAGTPVAAATVWSAGQGRPGLLEPVGVHPHYRGRGYGRAITLAAAAALHDLGSSAATVCTPTALTVSVATYESAGFARQPDSADRVRSTR